MEIRQSERKKVKIKLALQGSAGSGRTYLSLLLAKGLTGGDFTKIAIIDTIHFANTGKKIKNWCTGDCLWGRMGRIKKEIENCENIEALRYVYSKYPDLQNEIKPLILEKKQKLEDIYSNIMTPKEINNQNKHHQNGINTNK